MKIELNKNNRMIKVQRVKITGENGKSTTIDMGLDTRSTTTWILPSVIKRIGYKPDKLKKENIFTYFIASKIEVDDISINDVRINANEFMDLSNFGIEGVLGLNFIKNFKITINFENELLEIV